MVGLCLKELDSNSLKKNMKNCSLGLLKDKVISVVGCDIMAFT